MKLSYDESLKKIFDERLLSDVWHVIQEFRELVVLPKQKSNYVLMQTRCLSTNIYKDKNWESIDAEPCLILSINCENTYVIQRGIFNKLLLLLNNHKIYNVLLFWSIVFE